MVGMLLLLSGGVACGGPARSRPMPAPAAWLRNDPQRCLLQRDLREGMEDMARRCAEQFIRDNGYTQAPAEDSTRWVREASDDDEWSRVLATRLGSLEPTASAVQCSRRECVVHVPASPADPAVRFPRRDPDPGLHQDPAGARRHPGPPLHRAPRLAKAGQFGACTPAPA